MTEIISRAKRKDNGQWIEGYYCKHETRQPSVIDDSLREDEIQHLILFDSFADWNMPRQLMCAEILPETLSWYVARDDESKNKIFTGDICIFYTSTGYDGVMKHKGKVIFKDSKFMFWSDCYYDISEAFNISIIGNVTDNPELDKEGYVL